MRQITIEEALKKKKYKCQFCGREFSTRKGLRLHITRTHLLKDTWQYPDEEVEIRPKGRYVDVRMRIRKTFWEEIQRLAHELGVKPSDYILQAISLYIPEEKRGDTQYIG